MSRAEFRAMVGILLMFGGIICGIFALLGVLFGVGALIVKFNILPWVVVLSLAVASAVCLSIGHRLFR